jgi:cobalamin biosynthetic protein CobC
MEVTEFDGLWGADLAVVVNPNNPDGRITGKDALLALADEKRRRGGLLVVDEAFGDVGPSGLSLGPEVGRGHIVVLRSFGKFYGLAGLRLGFALAVPELAARLRATLGPWAVAGPAIAAGQAALSDAAWAEAMRAALAREAARLDRMLAAAKLEISGGTSLFRLARTPAAADTLFEHLGQAGILVRRFAEAPTWLRFGLPGIEEDWQRLAAALSDFSGSAV